jgi:putative radical SAM enzyme (TIGR03279 family)
MKNKISKVTVGGIGEEVGIEAGDVLLSINGTTIQDIIDYKFLLADDYVEVEIQKPDGEIWELEIEKEFGEDLGIEFEEAILDRAKSCSNKCIFCFIDQLPKGMRDTLYFKDDDSRLSFLQGNFVTLTNMKDEDIDRIIRYHISPINISVHTTNPDLRVKMLNNRFAGNVYERLKKLADAEITINAQIVVVPGVNNGQELINTVEDLYKLYPSVQNVAAVPVGITKFREGLVSLNIFDKESAKKEILSINKLQNKYINEIGTPFVRLSDEFYVLAQMDLPQSDFYEEYDQLEDGVGMIRLLRDTIEKDIKSLNKTQKGSFTMITGTSAFSEIKRVVDMISETNSNIKIDCIKIINEFFGETITVAGLLTGKDIINQLKGKISSKYLIMPDNMFRKGYELGNPKENIMLDDIKVKDIEDALDVKVIICSYTGEDLIQLINAHLEEEK